MPRLATRAAIGLLALVACSAPEEVAVCDLKAPNPAPCKNPLVLVPGLGASVLDVLYEDAYAPLHEICGHKTRNEWSSGIDRLWPSAADSFPDVVPQLAEMKACRLADLAVHFDPETRTFRNAPGVQVRPRGWGCVDGISNLFEFTFEGRVLIHPTMSSVYEDLIERLTGEHGYVIGQSLLGAPYDFRLVADDAYVKRYFADLKALIELAYDKTSACETGPKRVFVMGHSLGNPVLLYFLNTFVDQAWKDKYIRAFIPVGPPWTGSPKAYRTLLSGDAEGMPGDNFEFLAAERLMGGLLWMAPFPGAHGERDFVAVAGKEYGSSVEDYQEIFGKLAGRQKQALILSEIITPRAGSVADPGVLVGCLHGAGLPTEAHYTYASRAFDADPVIDQTVEGDGTVTLEVLELCKEWDQVAAKSFDGGEHLGLLHEERFLDHVSMLVTDCWSEDRSGPAHAQCPKVGTQEHPE
jgi:pimeloyl-ACP methyl ester carboxylesterase